MYGEYLTKKPNTEQNRTKSNKCSGVHSERTRTHFFRSVRLFTNQFTIIIIDAQIILFNELRIIRTFAGGVTCRMNNLAST